jgi:hypothetical protein
MPSNLDDLDQIYTMIVPICQNLNRFLKNRFFAKILVILVFDQKQYNIINMQKTLGGAKQSLGAGLDL